MINRFVCYRRYIGEFVERELVDEGTLIYQGDL